MGRTMYYLPLVVALLVACLSQVVMATRPAVPGTELTRSLRKLMGSTTTCSTPGDYAFVLDGSGSIDQNSFATLKSGVNTLATALTNTGNKYYYNQFGSTLYTYMSKFDDLNVFQTSFASLSQAGGSTNIAIGLNDALTKFSSTTHTIKYCFLFSDGGANYPGPIQSAEDAAKAAATALKSAGITVVAIAVGSDLNESLMQAMASPGYYIKVGDISKLASMISSIVATTCPIYCQNQAFNLLPVNGTCIVPACPPRSTGSNCYNVYVAGAQGTVTYSQQTPIVVNAGETLNTTVTATSGPQSCSGVVSVTCQEAPECRTNTECRAQLEPMECGTAVCVNKVCTYKPKYAGASCSDENPCTKFDKCDGWNMGPGSCKGGTPKNCAFSKPPIPALRVCYGEPFCDIDTGDCVWPLTKDAMASAMSANAYCATWGGAFATQLVNNGTLPSPSGSLAYSTCQAMCASSVCASATIPSCSCQSMAFSSSRVSAGTCPPCPDMVDDRSMCVDCKNGVYTDPADGSNPKATCWYPNPDVKNGQGGYLYPCPGRVFTQYALTGATVTAQCMGCMAFGAAYDKNATTCYAGNSSIPVDP